MYTPPLKEYNKSASVAWCPVRNGSNLLGLGTLGLSSHLELCTFDLADKNPKMNLVMSIPTHSQFRSIAWGALHSSSSQHMSKGILAGGLDDGSLCLWNPASILSDGDSSCLKRLEPISGAITCLEFNPLKDKLLAMGDMGGKLNVLDLEVPQKPQFYGVAPDNKYENDGALTCVAWNRKVPHIIGTSSTSGSVVFLDLKEKKTIISVRDASARSRPSSLSWVPNQPTQIVVAYDDDRNPSLQLWDLRNPSFPLKEIQGHSKGILDIEFNPMDPNLMLSCGKDNRTICWTFSDGQPEVFGEIFSQQWHSQVSWSPFLPGIFSATSLDDRAAIYTIQQSRMTQHKYVPKWYKRPCGVHCGFGGKIASFDESSGVTVKCSVVPTEQELIEHADYFEQLLTRRDYDGLCDRKIESAKNNYEKLTWSIVKSLFCFDRAVIIRELGYDISKLNDAVEKYLGRPPGSFFKAAPPENGENTQGGGSSTGARNICEVDPEKFFTELSKKTEEDQKKDGLPAQTKALQTSALTPTELGKGIITDWSSGPENLIKKCLLIGDITAAIDVALMVGRLADALVLSSAASPEVWQKTRNEYIRRQTDPFMKVIGCILNEDLEELVKISDLEHWKESLAIVCTYAKPEEFQQLCECLATRLEQEKFDIREAAICYLCAGNFQSTVQIWSNMAAQHGSIHAGLQDLVEKMAILKAATRFNGYEPLVAENLTKYAEILANSGRLMAAMRYLCLVEGDESEHSALLRDRIYNSTPLGMQAAGVEPPISPFQPLDVISRPLAPPGQEYLQYEPQQRYGMPSYDPSNVGSAYQPPPQLVDTDGYRDHINMPYGSQGGVSPQHGGMSPMNPQGSYQPPHHLTPTYSLPPQRTPRVGGGYSVVEAPPQYPQTMPPPSTPTMQYPPRYDPPPQAGGGSIPPGVDVGRINVHQPPPNEAHGGAAGYPPMGGARFPPVIPPASSVVEGGVQRRYPEGSKLLPGPAATADRSGVPPSHMQISYRGGPPTTPSRELTPSNDGNSIRNENPPQQPPGMNDGYPPPDITRPDLQSPNPPSLLGDPLPADTMRFIRGVLDRLVQSQMQQDAGSRVTVEIKRGIDELYSKLSSGMLANNVSSEIVSFCQAVNDGNYAASQRMQMDLIRNEWHEQNKNWLLALRRLMQRQ